MQVHIVCAICKGQLMCTSKNKDGMIVVEVEPCLRCTGMFTISIKSTKTEREEREEREERGGV